MNGIIVPKPVSLCAMLMLITALSGGARAAATDSGDSATVSEAAVSAATVEQPRSFGYMLGDIVTQRILLQFDESPFDPAELPRYERIGVWLERRVPRLEADPDGRLWLAVDYQIITSPQTLAGLTIPAWKLADKSGTRALEIAASTISVSPLSPRQGFAADGLENLRPDQPAPLIATAPMQRRLALWSGASLLTLTFWLGWYLWRNWRASSSQPFARALREMRRVSDASPQAWRALHRAFDRTAGQTIQASTLDALFAKAPDLISLRAQIEQFFVQSTDLFFGRGLPAAPVSVRELCVRLRRIEKRLER